MPIFASVFLALKEAGVPFLVIGGHAVVLHGHLRNTFDLDLLVADSKLAAARAALTNLGYGSYFETDAFLQLQAPENLPPLDLMIVDDQTFGRIETTANQKVLDGQPIRIPDVLRLIALKLHATRDTARRTTETDWQDVAGLLLATNRSLEDSELRTIISQYGGSEALTEIRRHFNNS
ncbi:MAG: hypothetical protein WB586_29700 [Chthoniobacterales bacterium]